MAGPSPSPQHKPRRKAANKIKIPVVDGGGESSSTSTSTGTGIGFNTKPAASRNNAKASKTSSAATAAVAAAAHKSGGHHAGRVEALVRTPSFPLAAFLWPARGSVSQWEVLPLILMAVGLFRWAAGLWGYSGLGRPPMYGDYEAQRHWMEITTQLPVSQWYFHDLEWWGLDYPPLTAYHSWVCGKIGALIDPAWFALHTSRGLEDPALKIFMRATVLVSEYLVYVPAAVVFVRRFSRLGGVATWSASVALVAILMQPATILVDHVHFQYNTVMLGFVLASMSSMLAARYAWAAVFFVAALAFKQMALYYAFSVFAYLLGSCVFPSINVARFLGIAVVTVASFALFVLPLLAGTYYDVWRGTIADLDHSAPLPLLPELSQYLDREALYYPAVVQLLQLVHRVFPFARGLFEDKVANFWCALNLVVKLRDYPPALLQRASLVATVAAILPPNLVLFFRPRKTLLPLAFAATAWGFFLFSYQVHEKSVLLPLLPTTALLAGSHGLGRDARAWVGFANLLGCWTMFPLLRRVDLAVPYAVLTLLWAYLLGLPPTAFASLYFHEPAAAAAASATSSTAGVGTGIGPLSRSRLAQWTTALVHGAFYVAMAAWHVLEALVPPPPGKPDLWVVANVAVGAAGFALCYLWCLWRLVLEADVLPRARVTGKGKAKAV